MRGRRTRSSSVKTVDRNRRNRHETRTITVFDATATVAETEWQSHVAAIIQVERDVIVRQADTGLWKRSLETSIYLSNRGKSPPKSPPTPFESTGESRTNRTTRVTSPSERTPLASEKIQEFSPDCEPSPTMSYAATNRKPCLKTGSLPRSAASTPCSRWSSVESVEQPCTGWIAAYFHWGICAVG